MSARAPLLCTLALVLAVSGCKKETPPPAPPAPPTAPPAAAPTPAAAPAPAPAPTTSLAGWVQALPAKAPAAKAGDVVWATIPKPGDEYAEWFGALKVEAVTGNTLTLLGEWSKKYTDVPAAVVYPLAAAPGLKPGDIATTAMHGRPTIGLVTKVEAGKIHLRYAWAGTPTQDAFEHAFPLVPGIAPLAWVHYQGVGAVTSRYKGMVVALEGDKVWILSGTGQVEVVPTGNAKPLALKKDYRAGQKIFAYIPGYSEVTVQKVLAPGFQYRVLWKVGDKDVPKDYLFHDLVESL